MKTRILALLEILLVYAVIWALGIALRSTGIVQWEIQNLGWSYTGMLIFVGIPASVIWLTRRKWVEYGITLADWQTNLDIGIRAYLVRIIPMSFLMITILWLSMDYRLFPGAAIITVGEVIGIAVMLLVLRRQQVINALSTTRSNSITTVLLFLFPIGLAFVMGKLTLIILSTAGWQFVFSGFGKEFVWRGYVQSRLNQAFGHPMRMFGVQFGWGLIIASLLFGLLHAFNTYDPGIGLVSLS